MFASAHQGKTDYRGGHKCFRNCDEWGLEKRGYHFHDKDWKPIRLNKMGNPIKEVQPESTLQAEPVAETSAVIPPEQTKQETKEPETRPVDHNPIVTIYEESILPSHAILLLALTLLLIVVLFFVRRKEKKN